MRPPLNRPIALQLARIGASRVISADRVAELEQIATTTGSAEHRVRNAEARCMGDLAKIWHAAWQRGFSLGHSQALEKLQGFHDELDARRKAIDRDLIGLVAAAVEKIVRGLPPALVTERLIEAALIEAQDELGRLVLRVHPSNVEVAKRWLREQSTIADGSLRVTVEPDAGMAEDGCTLETASGLIDTSLGVQFDALDAVWRAPASEL